MSCRRMGHVSSSCTFQCDRRNLFLFIMLSLVVSSSSAMPVMCTKKCNCTRFSEDGPIKVLKCPSLGLTKVPDLRPYPNLTEIDLHDNNISNITLKDFDVVKNNLIVIKLDNNKIHTIEEGVFDPMGDLKVLLLSNNLLESIPRDSFTNKNTLTMLDLSHNLFREIPPAVNGIREIENLMLNANPIGNLRAGAFNGGLNMLKIMDLSDTGMTHLNATDAGFNNIRGMEKLFLNGNYFRELNGSMVKGIPVVLTTLSLSYCGIRVIGKGAFETLGFLQFLFLDDNNLGVLKGKPFRGLTLNTLYLRNCNITDIKKTAFRGSLITIKRLYLNYNNINIVHRSEFTKVLKGGIAEGLVGVEHLDMGNSHIRELRGSPFSVFKNLTDLILSHNELTDLSMIEGLHGLPKLKLLVLTGNLLQKFPNFNSSVYPNLTVLFLTNNKISTITKADLSGMNKIEKLLLNRNPIVGFSQEEDDIFAETPNLKFLDFDDTLLTHLPNLKYLSQLNALLINNARLTALPNNICCSCARLQFLEAQGNFLREVPTLGCKAMVDINFADNMIESINPRFLHGMKLVRVLDLSGNMIEQLDHDFFNESVDMEYIQIGQNRITALPDLERMQNIIILNASFNRITEIRDGAFTNQIDMDILLLNNNQIRYIDPKAFSAHSDLKTLNLSRNRDLTEWVLPTGGFPHLAILSLEELWGLHQVPSTFEIPRIREVHFTYGYHCCIWKDYVEKETDSRNVYVGEDEFDPREYTMPTVPPITLPERTDGCEKVTADHLKLNLTLKTEVDENGKCIILEVSGGGLKPKAIFGEYASYVTSRTGVNIVFEYTKKVICTPLENPLAPCQNLMDPWLLRVAIWAVWVLTLLGNGTVLFVGIAAREKLESSEFLICNLAFADFCMGLYLVFLAIVDVRTFGSGTFFQSALDWQLGPGCKSAGFIAIFSNELSVFILVVLTIERVYTIAFAFKQSEKKKKKVVISLCVAGWLLAAAVAVLPFFGINSYNRVAVCLPYLTEDWYDKLYIGFLLSGNLVGFIIILLSYVYIFSSACRNSPITHSVERRKDVLIAASKIAILILTAFLCWAPTAVIGYLALFDIHSVSAAQAKYFLVFVFPLNACVNPFIYVIFTRRFRQKFASIFQRSNDKVTSFPPNHNLRLHRTQNAFTSEFPMSRVSSSGSHNPDEMMRMRQSRRSNSLVVQFLDRNTTTHSPSFTPPIGCNLGRRASLPAGFGSTLNSHSGCVGGSKGPPGPPHCMLSFGLAFSSTTSSLTDLQEENDAAIVKSVSDSPVDLRLHPLTSSQESNLRRLSVVVEDEDEGDVPSLSHGKTYMDKEEVYDSCTSSSSEDYSDASDSIPFLEGEGGTDLDFVMHSNADKMVEVCLQPVKSSDGDMSKRGAYEEKKSKKVRRSSFEFLAANVMLEAAVPQRKASSCSDIFLSLSTDACHSSFVAGGHGCSATTNEKISDPYTSAGPSLVIPSEINSDADSSTVHCKASTNHEEPVARICSSATSASDPSSTSEVGNTGELKSNPHTNTTSSNSTDVRQGLVFGSSSKPTSSSQVNVIKQSMSKSSQPCSTTSSSPLNNIAIRESDNHYMNSCLVVETDL